MGCGGIIFLNGTGTEEHPYDCNQPVTRDCHPGIYINKSLIMKSYCSVPHVSCIEGLNFQKATEGEQPLQFEISGIIFQQTSMKFEDYSDVKIFNCSFRDSSTALAINIRKSTNLTLNIQGMSLFQNNSACIKITLFDNTAIKDRYVDVRVNDTYFLENGYYRGGRSKGGVIKITADVAKPKNRLHLDVFCFKVKCIANRGSFIINNISSAVTREIYKNVQLKYNKGTSSYFSDARASKVDSLYESRAMKVRTTFLDVHCFNNTLLRCITATSHDIDIGIHNSQFTGQSVRNSSGGCLSLVSYGGITLAISNTTFSRNNAETGGAIYINCPNGTINIDFTDVNFSRCSSRKYGCAVSVGRPEHHPRLSPYKLLCTLRNVKVRHCSGMAPYGKCRSVYILLKSGRVRIGQSTWSNNLEATSGALFVETTGSDVDVEILDSIFVGNGASNKADAVVSLLALKNHSGNVAIVNSSFINKKKRQNKALNISAKYHIKLVNVTASLFWVGLDIRLMKPKDEVNICIDNCKFLDNIKDIYIYLRESNTAQLIIKNTIFVSALKAKSGYAIRIVVPPMRNVTFSRASITLDNNTFDSKPSTGIALFLKGEKNITIRNTTFRNCVCFDLKQWKDDLDRCKGSFRETATGAISVLTNPDTPLQFGCVESDAANDTHPLYSYDSHVLFEDTNFIDNLGLMAGGVYISNGNATFKRCTFQDNLASQRAGHVYSAYGSGQVNFIDCSFTNQKQRETMNKTRFDTASFLYSESVGPVYFQNTTMVSKVVGTEIYTFSVLEISNGGFVHIDDNTSIQCNTGHRLQLENNTHFVYSERNKSDCRINITVLRYSCTLCPPGFYSLQKGVSHGVLVGPSFECLSCPFGANCVQKNIAAKTNFWGHHISKKPPSLKFFACPEHYCQSPPTNSTEYNNCYGKRTGVLCGVCRPEYSETLFSSECRKISECNNFWMWGLTMLLLTTGFVLYLLIKPPVLSFLRAHIFWFRKRDVEHVRRDLGEVEEHSENGYLKITFYFYQAAELLIVGSAENLLHKIPFVCAVVAAFNFKVRSITNGIGCPFPGITAVTKELLLSATVLITMAEVAILFLAHSVFNIIRQKKRPSLLHYMAVALEILLLGYERLAETSLKLMHCVSIGSEKRLFFNGEVICWQWWQYILLAYIGIFVIPFVMVLYFGSSKLYMASISSKEFLVACIFPLPFLMYWLVKRTLKRKDSINKDRRSNKDVLEVLHAPFRYPNGIDKGTIYWESVLIGRRLILLFCHAFITTSMFRMVCMAGACVVMLLHHVLKNPYRDPIANKAETFSLLTLVMIAIINLTKATLISFGTSPDGPAKFYLETLEWTEVGALAFVPTLLCIFLMFAIFSQLVRLTLTLTKIMSRWVRQHSSLGFTSELQTPLLGASEED